MKICICISTFKRLNYLKILLEAVNTQEVEGATVLSVVVVDNDSARSSEMVVEAISSVFKYDLKYDVESKRGIPYSRNKAVSMAGPNTDFLVFIDDDEYPEINWIANLLKVQKSTNAQVVSGPVFPKYLETTPKWIINGNYFRRDDYDKFETGKIIPHTVVKTNNVLIDYKLIRKLSGPTGPFDETMGLIGCDDSDLANRIYKDGAKIVWSAEAVAWEWVPMDRANFSWIIQRAYRTANTIWLLSGKKDLFSRIKFIVSGMIRIVIGLLLIVPSLFISIFSGFQTLVNTIRIVVRGFGVIAGALGFQYEEYKHFYTTE